MVCTISPRSPHAGQRRCQYPLMPKGDVPVWGSNPQNYPLG